MAKPFARQVDIARAANVNASTVSRALNNDPRLPTETRERIRKIAATLGYRPDPLLSALASYRRTANAGRQRPGVAYLRYFSAPKEKYHQDLLQGAKAFAAKYGYTIDFISYGRQHGAALQRVLLSRGIKGLLIEPFLPADADLGIDLDHFAVVILDNPTFSRGFDYVTYDNFGGGREIVDQCVCRDYKKPGLLMWAAADRNSEHKLQGGFLMQAAEHQIAFCPEPLILPQWDPAAFSAWFLKNKIDVVITSQMFMPSVANTLAEMSLLAPRDVGLINSNIHELPSNFAGLFHQNSAIGSFAVELLIGKLARHNYGSNEHARVISQKGRWNEGTTLRPK